MVMGCVVVWVLKLIVVCLVFFRFGLFALMIKLSVVVGSFLFLRMGGVCWVLCLLWVVCGLLFCWCFRFWVGLCVVVLELVDLPVFFIALGVIVYEDEVLSLRFCLSSFLGGFCVFCLMSSVSCGVWAGLSMAV